MTILIPSAIAFALYTLPVSYIQDGVLYYSHYVDTCGLACDSWHGKGVCRVTRAPLLLNGNINLHLSSCVLSPKLGEGWWVGSVCRENKQQLRFCHDRYFLSSSRTVEKAQEYPSSLRYRHQLLGVMAPLASLDLFPSGHQLWPFRWQNTVPRRSFFDRLGGVYVITPDKARDPVGNPYDERASWYTMISVTPKNDGSFERYYWSDGHLYADRLFGTPNGSYDAKRLWKCRLLAPPLTVVPLPNEWYVVGVDRKLYAIRGSKSTGDVTADADGFVQLRRDDRFSGAVLGVVEKNGHEAFAYSTTEVFSVTLGITRQLSNRMLPNEPLYHFKLAYKAAVIGRGMYRD